MPCLLTLIIPYFLPQTHVPHPMQVTSDVRTQNPEGQVLSVSPTCSSRLYFWFVCLCFETGPQCIAQDNLELTVTLLHLPRVLGLWVCTAIPASSLVPRCSSCWVLFLGLLDGAPQPCAMPSAALLVLCRTVPSESSCDLSLNPLAFSRAEKKEIKE